MFEIIIVLILFPVCIYICRALYVIAHNLGEIVKALQAIYNEIRSKK